MVTQWSKYHQWSTDMTVVTARLSVIFLDASNYRLKLSAISESHIYSNIIVISRNMRIKNEHIYKFKVYSRWKWYGYCQIVFKAVKKNDVHFVYPVAWQCSVGPQQMYFLDDNWLIFTSKLATTVTGLRAGSDRPCCAKTEATRSKDQDTVSDKL